MASHKVKTRTVRAVSQRDTVFSRPPHPLGMCGEAIGVSLPSDVEWRIRRLANDEGKTVSRFLCDLLCDEFAVGHERDVLAKHGRIIERFWSVDTATNKAVAK